MRDISKYKGKIVKIKPDTPNEPNGQMLADQDFIIEDYWINLTGESWLDTNLGNPAVYMYALRYGTLHSDDKDVDDVVYGKVDGYGHLLHISELDLEND